ncbi:MAG: hypothetical protein IFK94_11725 [Acidobacteria bacterium]|uniref:DUF2339 domain-containing protein n=1 Tax=Candidatus Polarisedimenticola svalbardensis TaxID=2886004 RepID=A0A8J6Y0D4_9BACT|nr:hypothetical protein [Candidatus Polarisedimenticola svalbardensis]
MNQDVQGLERRIRQLSQRLSVIEERVAGLESATSDKPIMRYGDPEDSAADALLEQPSRTTEMIPLIGRTLLVLAGAFVLRAITEAGTLNQVAGTSLGILYAVAWFILADRAAGKGRNMAAAFYGLAGAIIAFPLLAESTIKFDVLSPRSTAVILAVVAGIALVVAWRRNLVWMAWVVALGSTATLMVLAVATKALFLFIACLLLLGVVTLWFGYVKGWRSLGWTIAVIVDGAVLMLGIIMLAGDTEKVTQLLSPFAMVILQLGLVVAYFGSFAVHTLTSDEDVGVPEMLQGTAAILISLGGAHAIALRGVVSELLPGLVSLVMAAGCYSVSFVFMDRKLRKRGNFIFYTTAGLAFTLAALVALLDGGPLVYALAAVAMGISWLGGTKERATLSLHGAVYTLAAAAAAGLFAGTASALIGQSVPGTNWINSSILVVMVAAAFYCWFPVATHGRTWGGATSRIPKFLVLATFAIGMGGIAITLGATFLPRGDDGVLDPAALAPLRTLILTVAAIHLAWVCRFPRLKEAAWLVYPVLIAGGLKLLLEDIRSGKPMTLVASFALFGGALILAPRLVRRSKQTGSVDA